MTTSNLRSCHKARDKRLRTSLAWDWDHSIPDEFAVVRVVVLMHGADSADLHVGIEDRVAASYYATPEPPRLSSAKWRNHTRLDFTCAIVFRF